MNSYVERLLARIAEDALNDGMRAVAKVQAEATAAGAFGGSRMYLLYDQAVGEVLKEALRRMAVAAFRASNSIGDPVALQLEQAGDKLADDITNWLQGLKKGTSFTGPPIASLKATLQKMVQDAVDDFRHGMVEEERLEPDPVVNVVNTITDSPGAVLQNVVGENNQQSVQHQALLKELDGLSSLKEFKELGEQNRLALQDLVDVLREEINKPKPDVSKTARWGRRLIDLAKQVGLHVFAAAVAHQLFVT